MEISRRSFLRTAGLATCGIAAGVLPAFDASASSPNKKFLSFRSLHTGEKVTVTYWTRGRYEPNALREIDHIMRDWRTSEVFPIDTGLLDLLFDLRVKLNTAAPYRVVSGFRSIATNAMLASRSHKVAKRSLHTAGMAVDVSLRGVDLRTLRNTALVLRRGGVGYYPRSNFVHIDTGRVRRW